jgi:hypothetical protein
MRPELRPRDQIGRGQSGPLALRSLPVTSSRFRIYSLTWWAQSRLNTLDLRKPCPEMPRDAWESLHGGSRKWFPEQPPRSPQSGTEQRLLAPPLPITGTSAPTGLKHQVQTGARPSMPKPGQDSRQRHPPNSDRHGEWTPRLVDKRVLARNAEYFGGPSDHRRPHVHSYAPVLMSPN